MVNFSVKNIFKKLFYHPVFSRIFAAIIGGYLFTNVMSLLLFFALVDNGLIAEETDSVNIPAIHSIVNSMGAIGLYSFLIYSVAALWIFHTRSATRAWLGMTLPSIIGVCVIYLLLPASLQNSLQG